MPQGTEEKESVKRYKPDTEDRTKHKGMKQYITTRKKRGKTKREKQRSKGRKNEIQGKKKGQKEEQTQRSERKTFRRERIFL